MKSDEIRDSFLRFFEERGHRRMPGAPLVPPGDPTLLFTSAGMVQFKPDFMSPTKPPHPRLTSVQKCFRTSDIDSVGDTSHLTFFEMLGNFSVGDYFKAKAIPWAWEFVTDKKWLGLDPDRLWASVFTDDDEAYGLWRKFLPEERVRRYGEECNYWFSGEIGPCGPCSELHYDFGPELGCGRDCEPDHDHCDRFLEIWNLVFMTYFCDGEKRDPLPSRNIDTGAGLERMAVASLFESKEWKDKSKLPSVYDTDLFAPIIKRIEKLSGKRYGDDESTDRAMRIVAEHARAVTFLIGDERTPVIPSNEERGYAVRRVLRRAVYFGRQYLGLDQPFLTDVAETVIRGMSGAYPELEGQRKFVLEILAPEERRFEETLSRGSLLADAIVRFKKEPEARELTTTTDEFVERMRKSLNGYHTQPTDAADLETNRQVRKEIERVSGEWEHRLYDLPKVATDVLLFYVDHFVKPIVRIASGITFEVTLLAKIDPDAFAQLGDRPLMELSSIEQLHHYFLTEEIEAGRWDPEAIDTVPLEEFIQSLKERLDLAAQASKTKWISGAEAFVLHDTYGFPLDLTTEIARESGFTVDEAGFEVEMEKQRGRARAAAKVDFDVGRPLEVVIAVPSTEFVGYETLGAESSIIAIFSGGDKVDSAEAPAEVELFLAETPFYPEGGGQVGDRGEIIAPNGRVAVEDTQTVAERLIVHRGRVVEGRIAVGDTVTARVDARHRQDTMRNHTGTHLLHAALRKVLGTHVRQSGSLVAPDHLRFDFTHTEPLTEEQIAEVQRLVNDKARQDLPVEARLTNYDQAMSEGVLAFFGEKYGEEVRVVEVNSVAPTFSAELCGGTHCRRTGEIGVLIITGESSIGAGMRRIEALTGRGAEDNVRTQAATLDEIARRLGAPREAVPAKLEALLAELDAERKKVERLERSLASGAAAAAGKRETYTIDGVYVIVEQVESTSQQALRFMGDALRREMASQARPSIAAVVGAVIDGKPSFLAMVIGDAVSRGLTADALVREIARLAGGGGGGRPDMATGGGKDPAKLAYALKQVPDIVRKLLAGT